MSTLTSSDYQWRSQRGSGGSNAPIEKCQKKISEDKIVEKYTKLKFARVKASSNDIINI